jgi:Cation efflux family
VSAGIESSGDVVAAVLTLFAIRLGARPADADHPYGHRRAENLAALGEAAILTGGGIVVVVEAIGRLAGRGRPFETHPYVFAVIVVALGVDLSRVLCLGGWMPSPTTLVGQPVCWRPLCWLMTVSLDALFSLGVRIWRASEVSSAHATFSSGSSSHSRVS